MKVYFERSPKEEGVATVGVETPVGSGFTTLHYGKRDLLRYAGYAAMAGVSLALHARKSRREKARRAPRRGRFSGK